MVEPTPTSLPRVRRESQPSCGHIAACRERIEGFMAQDAILYQRLRDAIVRIDANIARQVEAGDLDPHRRA